MSVVALRLAGPLQCWGARSRFVRRDTEIAPTKSGVLGLVAAAKGLRRTDPLEMLRGLRFGVRIDQPGQRVRDFQTAQRPKRERDGSTSWPAMPVSYRFYISDAVFLALLEGEHELVTAIDAALRRPVFPLYLGRRACPPAGPIALGVFDEDLDAALTTCPWQVSARIQQHTRAGLVTLPTIRDAAVGELTGEAIHDIPVSFDPNHRRYQWRNIVRDTVQIVNPHGPSVAVTDHDPMSALEGW
ncbi:type I-E CRISPR-associated protein Cas5/CasD [Nocardia brasiliensis]|uniref:type I-E CRISPR-associated protein Cas5/CasD n=1 Tax=Nocardia brasiliensis TaxID=37326 RepID=UPI003D904E6C